jgi:type IV pilus secretin PilQ/predicted competence protein
MRSRMNPYICIRMVCRIAVLMLCLTGGLPVNGQQVAQVQYGGYLPEESGDQKFANWLFQNADVRSVFANLASVSNVDIVVDPNVSGKISLKVTDKSWKEVFNIVCKLQNLAASKEDGYVFVMNDVDFRRKQLDNATNTQAVEQLNPLVREVIKLKNIKAEEMLAPVRELLSSRGKITVIGHNNSLVVFDTDDNIAQINVLIKKLDLETEQICISAKIVEVSSGLTNNLGVQWGAMGAIAGTQSGVTHLGNDGATGGGASGSAGGSSATSALNIIPGALEKVFYGVLGQDQFAVTMQMLFSDNKGEVVAQPQITTLDNSEARIFMGQQVPIKYLDEAKNVLIRMVDAGTELIVTPHITGNGRVMLKLNPKKKSYALSNGDPIISEQSAQTNVVLNDGETVVIAGLTSNEKLEAEGGIPFLKDIPLLGYLFKRSEKKHDKKDLIFFVTPHIINKSIEKVATEGNAAQTDSPAGE